MIPLKVFILDKAEEDIDNAYFWYELSKDGLGENFYDCIQNAIFFISRNYFNCPEIYKGVRRFIVNKFPYGIYYQVNMTLKEIRIIGVIHFKRNPGIWKRRIK
jgi:toxin ParE1/3/4